MNDYWSSLHFFLQCGVCVWIINDYWPSLPFSSSMTANAIAVMIAR
jgi:hypothetical protein